MISEPRVASIYSRETWKGWLHTPNATMKYFEESLNSERSLAPPIRGVAPTQTHL